MSETTEKEIKCEERDALLKQVEEQGLQEMFKVKRHLSGCPICQENIRQRNEKFPPKDFDD